jgi:4a-hydroxytetrahydrobiopterin dehydratase
MKTNSERHAPNALLNLLVFPGWGSVRSGRRAAGLGQIGLALAGTALVLAWFVKEMSQYYDMMFFSDSKPRAIGWIGELGGALFVISWLWAALTSLSLFREAAKPNPAPPVISPGANTQPLEAALERELAAVPAWQRQGQTISRTYEFADFAAAMQFVNAVAALAEAAQHHPDIDVRWNRVTLALTTHDAGGLTMKDVALARECDACATR